MGPLEGGVGSTGFGWSGDPKWLSVRKVSRSGPKVLRRSEVVWSVGKFDVEFDASGGSKA